MKLHNTLLAIAAVPLIVGQVNAAVSTQTGVANATVQTAGPRTGTSGVNFFNIEGSGNGTNGSLADFGVLDFSGSSFGLNGATSINSVSLTLTESNAAFTMPATLNFFLASNTTVSIANTVTGTTPDSPLRYQGAAAGTNGSAAIDPQLGTLIGVGTGAFATTGNPAGSSGTVDTYTLSLTSPGASAYLLNAINNGSTIRFAIVASEATAAATFGGSTNTTTTLRPSLTINAATTPEPASLGLLGLAGVALLRRRVAQA